MSTAFQTCHLTSSWTKHCNLILSEICPPTEQTWTGPEPEGAKCLTMTSILSLVALLALAVTDYSHRGSPDLFLFSVVHASSQGSTPNPQRQTLYGRVRGTIRTLHFLGGRQVERYLGVPYASPPVGKLRFEVRCSRKTSKHRVWWN